MSVTAAAGFVASGVHAGIRRARKDLAVVRSVPRATGAAMWTRNRVQAAPVVVSKAHLELAQPAGDRDQQRRRERAHRRARRARRALHRRRGRPAPRPRRRGGARPLHGRDRRAAAARPRAAGLVAGRRRALGRRRRATRRRRSSPRTRARRRPSSRGGGFTVGGMAKGTGMIHPDLATMLAVVTTHYPLEPARRSTSCARPSTELQHDLGGRREVRRTTASCLLASARAADAARRRGVRARAPGSAATSPRRSSPTARAPPSRRDRRPGAATAEARAIARRIGPRRSAKTALFGRDANWGRVLAAAGGAPYNGGSPASIRRASRSPGTAPRCSTTARRARRAGRRRADRDRARPRPRRRRGELPHERPLLRVCRHQRGVPLVSRVVVKSAARSRPTRRPPCWSWRGSTGCASSTAPGRRSPATRSAGPAVEFVGGRRVTTPPVSRSCACPSHRQRRALRRDRPARRPARRRRDRLRAVVSPSSG